MSKLVGLEGLITKYKQDAFLKLLQLREKYDKFYSKFPKKYIISLKNYKGTDYFNINEFLYNRDHFLKHHSISLFESINKLYNGKNTLNKKSLKLAFINQIQNFYNKIINDINNIDFIFKKAPVTREVYQVFRGISFHDENIEKEFENQLKKLKKGEKYIFKNYLSTSLMNTIALSYIDSQFSNSRVAKCCLFKILIPKNKKFLFLDSKQFTNKIERNEYSHLGSEYEILLPRNSTLKFVRKYPIKGNIPVECKINNSRKSINDIMVYEMKYIGVITDIEPISKNSINDFSKFYYEVSQNDINNYTNIEYYNIKQIH